MAITRTTEATSESASTVELFASFGVAVLPGSFGEKGSRCKDWPTIDPPAACELTLRALRERCVNVVLRTGPELGAIDIDGKAGVDPSTALERLLAILPDGVAVYRSLRGFGILFRPKRVLGDGLLPVYGAELFTAGHLINIPPSRHPSGVDYEWVIPPGGRLPTVDLEALGLLPEAATAAATNHQRQSACLAPAAHEDKAQFRRLMATIGVVPRRGGQELHHCPWHSDPNASLSVNWEAAVFNDFAGCGQGGIADLRQMVGEPAGGRPKRITPMVTGTVSNARADRRSIDPEIERSRLVRAMKESGVAWPFDRNTGRAVWEDVLECHVAMVKYECSNGHRVAYPKSCGFPLCPACMPTRLRADFRRHSDNLPARLALFIVAPPDGTADRSDAGAWFRSWRRKSNLTAGFYGVRLRIEHPDVLLVLPADQVPASIISDPHVTLVSAEMALDEAVAWYVEMFLEEISSWRTPEEMLTLLAAVKGRRRFQGFGKYYADKKTDAGATDEDHLFTGEPKKVYRAVGGSAKGGAKALACPMCGTRMRAVGIALSAEGMAWNAEHGFYMWGIGPPAENGAQYRPVAMGATS